MWRITGTLNMLPLLVGAGFAALALSRSGGVPLLFEVLPVLAILALAGVVVGVVPGLRWRRWRYEIRPDEVHLGAPTRPAPRVWAVAARGEVSAGGSRLKQLTREQVASFAQGLVARTGLRVFASLPQTGGV